MKFILSMFLCFQAAAADFGPSFKSDKSWRKSDLWKPILKKIDEQKFKAARDSIVKNFEDFQENEKDWVIAIIQKQRLEMALGEAETSVENFQKEKWPKSMSAQFLLSLYYAQALENYYSTYSYEINNREQVSSKKKLDLKKWSKQDIFNEIQKTLYDLWSKREKLADVSVKEMSEFIQRGSYPDKVRFTLRDAYSYFYTAFLQNTQYWTAEESNDKGLLDLNQLLKKSEDSPKKVLSKELHPLKKINIVLTDLENWHWKKDRLSSLLEARIEKVRVLKNHFSEEEQKEQMQSFLQKYLRDYKSDPWWSEGTYLRAVLKSEMSYDESLIDAIKIANTAVKAHKKSIGGQRAAALISRLKAPQLEMASLLWDRANQKTLQMTYKNWKKVHFRAFKFKPEDYFKEKDRGIFPGGDNLINLYKRLKVHTEWSEDLKDMKDYRSHKKYVKVPINEKGFYLIVASAEKSFSENNNKIVYTFYNQTNLHVINRREKKGMRVYIHSALTGEKRQAQVKVYQSRWNEKTKEIKTYKTDKKGDVFLVYSDFSNNYNYFFKVESKDDAAYSDRNLYLYDSRYHRNTYFKTLVFTDRSIYRPGQKIHFKVMSYEDQSSKFELPKARANAHVTVELFDGNGERVAQKELETNKFATASGEFEIPKGRFLGNWSIRTSDSGYSTIKVEEYKRPTFLTKLNEAKSEIRLNKKASFSGDVKYYFGLPVQNAKVKYKVTRTINYPYWYWWWYPAPNTNNQIVKVGSVKSNDKGEYTISFTPKAKKGKKGLTYNYKIEVEVLNEGGETAKTSKTFIIGDVAVKGSIGHKKVLFPGQSKIEINFNRTDLNGKGLAGKSKVQIFKLKKPKKLLYPTVFPFYIGPKAPKPSTYKSKDDLARNRWTPLYQLSDVLKTHTNGKKLEDTELIHDKTGRAELSLKSLKSGSYRILFKTKDKFGASFESQSEFTVLENKKDMGLPFVFEANKKSGLMGDVVQFFIKSDYPGQKLYFELYAKENQLMNEVISGEKLIKYRIAKRDLGGLMARAYAIIDHQLVSKDISVSVPYVTKNLDLSWERIRKKVYPGTEETWSLIVKTKNEQDKTVSLAEQAEVLAYMYDQSLDAFISHMPPSLGGRPRVDAWGAFETRNNLMSGMRLYYSWYYPISGPSLYLDRITIFDSWGIGGFGYWGPRGGFDGLGSGMMMAKGAPAPRAMKKSKRSMAPMEESVMADDAGMVMEKEQKADIALDASQDAPEQPKEQIRSNFSETAFFKPHLLTNKKGEVKFSFKVPDSLTAWNVWAVGITKDLDFGITSERIESVKDLMVRTYFPRFLREGDKIKVKVVVDNAGEKDLEGKLLFDILDDQEKKIHQEFKLDDSFQKGKSFSVKKGSSINFTVDLEIPYDRLGEVKFKAFAKTKEFTDGEVKPLPILPSRIHLAQSRFVTLKNKESRELIFEDMLKEDATLVHDSLVLKLDAQLFYSVLSALPYLVNYPYECSEQTLNRFLSTAILSQTYKQFPDIAKMAQKMSKRKTQYESLNAEDPNRKMSLEETPWLRESRGEGADTGELLNMLKPRVVKYQKDTSLRKLLKLQNSDGGFTWFAGGRSSFYMTKYILYGFAKAAEFGVDIPKSNIQRAFTYSKAEFKKTISWCYAHNSCWEWITYLNFIMSAYGDESYFSHAFSKDERKKMLDFSFSHWKRHQPMLKGMLALTLEREKRHQDAVLVLGSVLDSAKEERDLGVYWAPEDRSWLWYNDTIETHAFALRTIREILPEDKKKHGLVQWLFLNKKLNHWKSTRATSEVIYSVLYYLKAEKLLGTKERAVIEVGDIKKEFNFDPNEYTGKDNFVVIKGEDIKPKKMHKIKVEQKTKGMMFASATWHYSTEKLPESARGDFFNVKRQYFKRVAEKKGMKLLPLDEGAKIEVGDQLEVHISISSKHAAEYVHLRDPRPAGFEPERSVSGYKWDLGLVRYEEVRDSGMNFFFEQFPVGEYTLKHRMRANLAGEFRTHPATLESIYAPEFKAFSSGKMIKVD